MSDFCEKRNALKKIIQHNNKKITCSLCLKDITASNYKRHQKLCKELALSKGDGSICEKCGARYLKEARLKYHLKTCNGIYKGDGTIRCTFEECNATFLNKMSLIKHLKIIHKFLVKDPETHHFSSIDEFERWKEKEEEATFSYFVKRSGEQRGHIYYYCQHDGPSRPHCKKNEVARLTGRKHKKGQIKTDKVCIAMMQLNIGSDRSCSVKYFPTHNHPLSEADLVHHRQTRHIYSLIDEQIALGVPPIEIVNNLKERFGNDDKTNNITNKVLLINRKQVKERARRIKNATFKSNQLNFEIANNIFLDCKSEVESDDSCEQVGINHLEKIAHKLTNYTNMNSQQSCKKLKLSNEDNKGMNDIVGSNEDDKEMIDIVGSYKEVEFKQEDVACPDVKVEVSSPNTTEDSLSCIIEMEESLLPDSMIERSHIVENIKKSCQTLIALTDFMSEEVLNLAYSSIDNLVRKCEGLIDSEDDPKPQVLNLEL